MKKNQKIARFCFLVVLCQVGCPEQHTKSLPEIEWRKVQKSKMAAIFREISHFNIWIKEKIMISFDFWWFCARLAVVNNILKVYRK